MVRIVHVGNFGTRAKGAALNSVGPKLSRGLVRAGHAVIDFDDREAARAAIPLGTTRFGGRAANQGLLRLVLDNDPDLLLLGHADVITSATLAAARRARPRMRVVLWNVDPLFENGTIVRLQAREALVDALLVSTAGEMLAALKSPGVRVGFLPNPVDFSVETGRAHEIAAPLFDVFFACGHPQRPYRSLCGAEWDMDGFFRALAGQVPGLRLRLAGLAGAPHLAGTAYQHVLGECAMGLNASKRNDVLLYSSDRLAHIMGSGELALVDRATGYGKLFSDAEMGFFDSIDELAALVRRMIAEPAARQAAAAAGRARYHTLFNETLVARYVLEVAFDCHNPADYEWPTLAN